jgi:hypothetical protein
LSPRRSAWKSGLAYQNGSVASSPIARCLTPCSPVQAPLETHSSNIESCSDKIDASCRIPPMWRALLPSSALQSPQQLDEDSPVATIDGIGIPDSKLCKEITELVRHSQSDLLFNHSSRVYYFGALTGVHRGLNLVRELLYAGAMFHDWA